MAYECKEGKCEARMKRNFVLSIIAIIGAAGFGTMAMWDQMKKNETKIALENSQTVSELRANKER